MKKNERGFAIVYGLVVLLLASVAGTALLFMTQKDRTGATDYARMRIASQAAVAALRACEGQFLTQPDVALAILKKVNTTTKTWMLGTADQATSEQKISLGSATDAPKYSARIVSYDGVNSFVTIEGTGYLQNGGRKRVLASYQLAGLAMVTTIVDGPSMYLNGFSNLDHALKIVGNVWAGGTSILNGNNTPTLTITGKFKTGTGSFVAMMPIVVNTGNTFFRGPIEFQSNGSTFNGKCGFKASTTLKLTGCPITCNNNVYLNCSYAGNRNVIVSGASHTAYYASTFGSAKITASNSATTSGPVTSDIPAALGMTDADDVAPTIVAANSGDLEAYIESQSPPGKVYDSPALAGINPGVNDWNLNAAYSSATKWKNFLVVKVPQYTNFNNPITTLFTGKIIWIFDATGGTDAVPSTFSLGNWYSSAEGSNTLLYVRAKKQYFTDFGQNMPGAAPVFRGVIYQASTAANSGGNYKFKGGTSIYGSIIHPGSLGPQFNTGSAGLVTLSYDATIVNEFVTLGILKLSPGPDPTPVLTLVDTKIRPTLLSMQL